MPSIKDFYPDKWLTPGHLQGRSVSVVIESVTVEQLYNPRERKTDPKIVLSFYAKKLRLPLNKTQAFALAQITQTDDYTKWIGHGCVLSPAISQSRQPTIQIGPPTESRPEQPEPTLAVAADSAEDGEEEDDDHLLYDATTADTQDQEYE